MTMRYFSFTDGKRTYFRASTTRAYQSGSVYPTGYFGFSGRPADAGTFAAVEIGKPEYNRLLAAKKARLGDADRYSSPQDSWVDNGAIGEG